MTKFKTFAPVFPGFYNTLFEYDNEEYDIQSYNEENGTNLGYDDFEWDYEEYHNRIASIFVDRLETELKQILDITIKFEYISSPKFYNYSNDVINIEVDVNLPKLIRLISKDFEESKKYFKGQYTSSSGFISLHSNDICDWIDPEYILENPEHRIGALLECICCMHLDDFNDCIDSEMWIGFSPINKENQ